MGPRLDETLIEAYRRDGFVCVPGFFDADEFEALLDAEFFHCNTLHGSASNETDTSRLMLFASYNAESNEPIPDAQGTNEEGKFMNIAAQERKFRPLE